MRNENSVTQSITVESYDCDFKRCLTMYNKTDLKRITVQSTKYLVGIHNSQLLYRSQPDTVL